MISMNRTPAVHRAVLIGSTLLICWLGMQATHELGHVLGAWLTGGEVVRVVLHPFTISRTDLGLNPSPLTVVWAGPVTGCLLPLLLWGLTSLFKMTASFLLRFFAGFCLIANGLYIGLGSFAAIGDCGEMLRHGSASWQLWAFGLATAPAGLWLWQGQGKHFGLGNTPESISPRMVYTVLAIAAAMLILEILFGGEPAR
jgi:hypothetical protein